MRPQLGPGQWAGDSERPGLPTVTLASPSQPDHSVPLGARASEFKCHGHGVAAPQGRLRGRRDRAASIRLAARPAAVPVPSDSTHGWSPGHGHRDSEPDSEAAVSRSPPRRLAAEFQVKIASG
jgi:hypothetical protein